MEDKKNNPTLKLSDIKIGTEIEIKLISEKAVASGASKFGKWNLWAAEVNNMNVYTGRGKDETQLKNYSGEVVFFPPEKLNEKLLGVTNGEKGVTVKIRKEVKESKTNKVFTVYEVTKVSGGTVPLTSLEKRLVESAVELIKDGDVKQVTEKMFISGATVPPYNCTVERAKEIYGLVPEFK